MKETVPRYDWNGTNTIDSDVRRAAYIATCQDWYFLCPCFMGLFLTDKIVLIEITVFAENLTSRKELGNPKQRFPNRLENNQ
jgi:hypothetical protein